MYSLPVHFKLTLLCKLVTYFHVWTSIFRCGICINCIGSLAVKY